MRKTGIAIFTLFALACFSFSSAWGGAPTNKELLEEINILKAKVEELEKRLAEQESKSIEADKVLHGAERAEVQYELPEKKAEKIIPAAKTKPVLQEAIEKSIKIEKVLHGAERAKKQYEPGEEEEFPPLTISADGTFILQGTPSANNAGDGEDSRIDGSWSADIELEKAFSNWGLAFFHLEAGQGDGLEPELSLFSNVNRDAMGSGARIEVTELWYEHYLFNKIFALGGGKLDFTVYFDQNEYANDETTQFLGRMFRNSPVIEFPDDNALGLHSHIWPKPMEFLEFDIGCFATDTADWNCVFDHLFYMAQLNFKPERAFDIEKEMWSGNYRFYWWLNSQRHAKFVRAGEPESTKTKDINYGFGFSCDQMVTDIYGVFCRFGWQRPDIALAGGDPTLEWSWSAGAQMTGKYWWREDDVLALAVGQALPSRFWKKSSEDNCGAGEGHLEVYYKCRLNRCLAISPDIQLIWNPNGVSKSSEGDNDTIFVYGVRGQFDF